MGRTAPVPSHDLLSNDPRWPSAGICAFIGDMNRLLFTLFGLVVVTGTVAAHPLPNLRFDRTIHVRLSADAVTVRYSLEINDWTMILDGKNLLTAEDTAGVTGSASYAEVYAARKSPVLADQLRAMLDDEPLTFSTVTMSADRARDHLQFRFEFRADWQPSPGRHSSRSQTKRSRTAAGQSR